MSYPCGKHSSLIVLGLLAGAWAAGAAAVAAKPATQSSSTSSQSQQSQSSAAPSTAPSSAKSADGKDQASDKDSAKDKKKPKKVWTEDDISKVGGTISVVGDSSASSSSSPARNSSESEGASNSNSAKSSQVDSYRDQIRQLQGQLDATDKKINDLRNFKADNSSASGGINPNHGYSMTPIPDQIKQLEEKKKQIQDKIDALTDEARKKGIDPHDLR
jgi:hypothetical protein